jgi:predicted metal-dependent enzyme (double-stranded beta helix superfamily)
MAAVSEALLAAPLARVDAVRTLIDLSDGLGDAFFAVAQRTLRALIGDPDLMRHLPPADADRFARRLLYTDPLQRFGIWALSWPPGWQTPIHNHHCACAFAVQCGSIEEMLYAVRAGSDVVVETGRALRPTGYVGGAPLERGIVHGMRNCGDGMAVSIHLYAYRPDRHADSIDRCFVSRSDCQDPR